MSHTKEGWKSIHVIAGEGNLKLFEELVQRKRNLKLLTKDRRTMLHIAALNARFAFVKRLLEVCPELIDNTDVDGWTALHFSVAGGDVQVFQEIVKRGLSPRTPDKYGITCLHVAAQRGRYHIVKNILDICPDVLHMKTNSGRTAIHETIEGGHVGVFQELVRRGLPVTSQDESGITCLHLAAAKGHNEFIRQILAACPEVKTVNRFDGATALHEAASRGFVNVFIELVKHGLSIHSFSETTGTCLHVASYNGKLEMVQHILKTCPELSFMTTAIDSWTPLHLAAAGGHIDVFKLLQMNGADPRCLTAYKGTIFHVAIAHGKCEMVRHLLTVCPDLAEVPRMDGWTPIHQCAADGQINIYDVLKATGVSVDSRGKYGETCLHIAASCGQYQMVKHIAKTSHHLLNVTKIDGRTVLHEAAAGGSIKTFDELVRNGVPKTVTSQEGETCLHAAAFNGRYNMVSHLINLCPELLHVMKRNGWSALHDAASEGHVETCEILVRAGLSHCTRTSAGETVEDIARKYNQRRVVEFILHTQEDCPESRCDIQQYKLDEQNLNMYLLAVKGQREKRRNIRLMVVGYEGVGKTSLCWRLMDRSLLETRPSSTDGIDIYINRFLIDLDTMARKFLDQETGHEASIQRIRDVVNEFRRTSLTENTTTPDYKDKLQSIYTIDKCIGENSAHSTAQLSSEPVEIDDSDESQNIGSVDDDKVDVQSKKDPKATCQCTEEDITKITHRHDVRRVMSGLDTDFSFHVSRKAYVSLWDFGGHKEFYNSHHLFLSSDAIYILVFNVYECLISTEERRRMKFWLQSIKAHSISMNDKDHGVQTPPIILIGTHVDLIPGGLKEQQDAHRRMESLFYSDPDMKDIIKSHVFGFFTINTLTEPENTFDEIWDTIIGAAPYQSQWERLLPARWLTLERELMKRRADGVKVMSVRNIMILGQELETPTHDAHDIHQFLRYLHLSGEILNFSGKENIVNIVVIDPQWIVHAFRRLITAPKFHHRGSTRFKILWDIYKKSAVLGTELLSLAWGRDTREAFLDHKETLLYIMERFGLIASPPLEQRDAISNRSDIYFVSAMLEDADPTWLKQIIQLPDTTLSKSLCFVFRICVPFTIIDKVLAICVQKFEPYSIPGYDCSKWLQRGLACFKISPQMNMLLCCSDSVVKATLLKHCSSSGFDSGAGYHVRCMLEETIAAVLQFSHQLHLEYDYFLHSDFTISAGEQRVQVKDLSQVTDIPCWSSDSKKKVMIQKKDYDVWFQKPMNTMSLDEIVSKTTGQVPYNKSLRVTVVAVDNVRVYTNDRGQERKVLNAAVADATKAAKVVIYDPAKFPRFQEGNSLLIRNFIRKQDGIVVTSVTKVYPTHKEEVPDAIRTEGVNIIRPKPASIQPLKTALKSPIKTKVSVQGHIIQEEAPQEVMVRNDKVKVKAIYLRDVSHPKCKVSLWRDAAEVPFRTGDHIVVTDVVVNSFRNEVSLSTTSLTKIERTEAPEESTTVEVVGACMEDLQVTLLCKDDTEVEVPLDIINACLPQDEDVENYILSKCNPFVKVCLTYKGSSVTKIEL